MQQCAFTILSITQIREEQKRSAQKLNVSVKQIILIIFHQNFNVFRKLYKKENRKRDATAFLDQFRKPNIWTFVSWAESKFVRFVVQRNYDLLAIHSRAG